MFYLVLLIPAALVYFFLISDELKKTLNIFFILGVVTVLLTVAASFVFNYHYNILEIIFYFVALVLTIEGIREIEKMT